MTQTIDKAAMTPEAFRAWRRQFFRNQREAAEALDMSVSAIQHLEAGRRRGDGKPASVSRVLALACAALAAGLDPWRPQDNERE